MGSKKDPQRNEVLEKDFRSAHSQLPNTCDGFKMATAMFSFYDRLSSCIPRSCLIAEPSSGILLPPYSLYPFLLPNKLSLDPHSHLNLASQLLTPKTTQLLHPAPRFMVFCFYPSFPEGFEVFRKQGDPRHHVAFVSE